MTWRVGRKRARKLFAAAAVASAIASAPASARELHWRSLDVRARLEADGTLAVAETQAMVFTGDWNGGERSFNIRAGQELELDRIVRIDPATGEERELRQGDLGSVDHWDWGSSSSVRWRSRLPSDPEFDSTRIDYRIEYRLTGALKPVGERGYRLDHDFAFSDRAGVIEKVVARLEVDPVWRFVSPHPESWSATNLPPGQGFVVPVELEYTGAGAPARATPPRPPLELAWGVVAAFAAAVLFFVARLFRREGALGRFAPEPRLAIDRAWIEEHVLSLAPELVGAAWDRNVGSAEVAALLARLTAEGKLASEVKSSGKWILKRNDLHLRILVDRSQFNDYERSLVDALFGTSDVTDTQSLRQRYKSSGFDPAAKIRGGVESSLKRIRGFSEGSPKPSWKPTGLLFLAGFVALLVAFVLYAPQRGIPFFVVGASIVPWLFLGLPAALYGQSRTGRFIGPLLFLLLVCGWYGTLLAFFAFRTTARPLHLVGALLWFAALARSLFNIVATRESAEGLARRRELTRARDWLEAELKRPKPDLDDRWFPYLLAFGLAPNVDKWFQRFGGTATTTGWSPSTSGGSIGGGSWSGGGSSWSGGGGAFGGAGATATWALAATAMSAGVSAPSSSGSGGGGGGGGGGSSGGGGGGGW